ncbi:hypothetical protein [Halogeometricum rufum]|nr:hypothetical protein [Halogeometricum rufum]
MFRDPAFIDIGSEVCTEKWSELYPLVQSYIYNSEVGRSRMFQSIFSFARSMFVLLTGLPVLYAIHFYFRQNGTIARPPKYLLYFPSYADFMEVVIPLCIAGALLFGYTAYSYKRYFAEYLISDFVALREQESRE